MTDSKEDKKDTKESLFEKYHAEFRIKTASENKQYGEFAFRGQADALWNLESAAFTRLGLGKNHENYKQTLTNYSKELINDVKLNRWHWNNQRALNDLEILALLQHYGAATSLLDFTHSFHVALWFACQKTIEEKNGKVFIIDLDTEHFKKIEEVDLGEKLEKLLQPMTPKKIRYWESAPLTERITRQDSVFVLEELSEDLYHYIEISAQDKEPLLEEMRILFNLRPENLFKDIIGFASVNRRNDLLPPTNVDNCHALGAKFFNSKNYEKAEGYFSRALQFNEKHIESLFMYSTSQVFLGKNQEAIKNFEKINLLNPKNNGATYFMMSAAYNKMGNRQKAEECLQKAKDLGAIKPSEPIPIFIPSVL